MNYLTNKKWWQYAGTRAIKTFFQTAVAAIGASVLISDVHWGVTLSAACMAAIISLATSLGGLPEMDNPAEDGNGQNH
jgi:hypothetical protein